MIIVTKASSSKQCGEFLDWLRNSLLLKEDFAPQGGLCSMKLVSQTASQ